MKTNGLNKIIILSYFGVFSYIGIHLSSTPKSTEPDKATFKLTAEKSYKLNSERAPSSVRDHVQIKSSKLNLKTLIKSDLAETSETISLHFQKIANNWDSCEKARYSLTTKKEDHSSIDKNCSSFSLLSKIHSGYNKCSQSVADLDGDGWAWENDLSCQVD